MLNIKKTRQEKTFYIYGPSDSWDLQMSSPLDYDLMARVPLFSLDVLKSNQIK